MSDAVLIALIAGLSAGVPGMFIAALRYFKIEKVHKATNSLVQKLIDEADEKGHKRGVEEERERTK